MKTTLVIVGVVHLARRATKQRPGAKADGQTTCWETLEWHGQTSCPDDYCDMITSLCRRCSIVKADGTAKDDIIIVPRDCQVCRTVAPTTL